MGGYRAVTAEHREEVVYVGGEHGYCVIAIDGATNQRIARIPAGFLGTALCCNPTHNKVYCANTGFDITEPDSTVTVIDCATNTVKTTITPGLFPSALCYNPQNNKVYCGHAGWDLQGHVSVIDGLSDTKSKCRECGTLHYENWNEYQLRQKLEGAAQKLQQAQKYLFQYDLEGEVTLA